MQRTKIAYLTHTWNPIAMRCDKVSIGCDNCWHLKMAKRLAGNTSIPLSRRVSYQGHMPYLLDDKIEEFSRLRKPAVLGLQFMGDLFHKRISRWQIDDILQAISDCEQHQV